MTVRAVSITSPVDRGGWTGRMKTETTGRWNAVKYWAITQTTTYAKHVREEQRVARRAQRGEGAGSAHSLRTDEDLGNATHLHHDLAAKRFARHSAHDGFDRPYVEVRAPARLQRGHLRARLLRGAQGAGSDGQRNIGVWWTAQIKSGQTVTSRSDWLTGTHAVAVTGRNGLHVWLTGTQAPSCGGMQAGRGGAYLNSS